MRSVSVIGIGETAMGQFPDKSLRDLIKEAGDKAIEDAGIEKDKIECLHMGNFNSSYLCNQSHIGALASEVLDLGDIPTLRSENACASGSLAFRYAYSMIAAGIYDVMLVGGVEKMSHRSTEEVTSALASASDNVREYAIGANFPSLFAMIAKRHMHEYGTTREQLAMCAVQNHENGFTNPDAQMRKQITVEKALKGFPISDPFTLYDCSLVTDGSAFVVIAATDVAKKLSKKTPIEVVGSGHAGDTLTLATKSSLTSFPATKKAAAQAYKQAGIKADEVDLAEVHDCFSITQIINTEDLGFFEPGQGGPAVEQGKTALDGEVAINPSGGLKSKGHPIGATGISQIYEVITQLRGEAGERQVKDAKIGLTQNIGGTASTCCVHIFKRS